MEKNNAPFQSEDYIDKGMDIENHQGNTFLEDERLNHPSYYPYPAPTQRPRQRRGEKWEGSKKQENLTRENRKDPNPSSKKWTRILSASCVTLALLLAGITVANGMMIGYIQTQVGLKETAYEQYVNRHPYHYRQMIESEANKYNLDPAFVAAIILNESSFKKDAESSVGARGLMQVMGDTAQWIASKLGEEEKYHFDLMYQAEANIRYGAWYLGFLSQRFNGDPVLVAGAYHAGQGEVGKWLNNKEYSLDGRTIEIENMIDGPTKRYVKKVTQAYGAYKGIYYTKSEEIL